MCYGKGLWSETLIALVPNISKIWGIDIAMPKTNVNQKIEFIESDITSTNCISLLDDALEK